LSTPTTLAVENIAPAFSVNPMPNYAKHDLLSSAGSTDGRFTELTVTWGGSNLAWQAVNRNAANGVVVYDTGLHTGVFTNAGVPGQLRLDTGTYNHAARYFGTTDIQVTDTTGTRPNQPPGFTHNPIVKPNATAGLPYSNSIAGDATDPNCGDTLTFSKVDGPLWLNVATSGALSGMPAPSDTGTNNFTVRVADSSGASSDATLRLIINPAPPVILPCVSVSGGSFTFQFAGAPGQHYRVEFAPALPAAGPWQVVTDIFPLGSSPFSVSHPLTNSQGFYRVGIVP